MEKDDLTTAKQLSRFAAQYRATGFQLDSREIQLSMTVAGFNRLLADVSASRIAQAEPPLLREPVVKELYELYRMLDVVRGCILVAAHNLVNRVDHLNAADDKTNPWDEVEHQIGELIEYAAAALRSITFRRGVR